MNCDNHYTNEQFIRQVPKMRPVERFKRSFQLVAIEIALNLPPQIYLKIQHFRNADLQAI